MSHPNAPIEDALDRAIERTLRGLVQVEPPDSLSARVMTRIAASATFGADQSRAGLRVGRWPILAALGAAAAIALAIAWTLTVRSPLKDVDRIAIKTAQQAPPPVTARDQREVTTEATSQMQSSVGYANRPGTRAHKAASPVTVAALEPSIAIEKLDAPERIDIQDIAPPAVEIAALDIPQLEIEPIDMSGRTPER